MGVFKAILFQISNIPCNRVVWSDRTPAGVFHPFWDFLPDTEVPEVVASQWRTFYVIVTKLVLVDKTLCPHSSDRCDIVQSGRLMPTFRRKALCFYVQTKRVSHFFLLVSLFVCFYFHQSPLLLRDFLLSLHTFPVF